MENINLLTVIANIIISAITAYTTTIIIIENFQKKLESFRDDTIETCTTEVAKYVKSIIK